MSNSPLQVLKLAFTPLACMLLFSQYTVAQSEESTLIGKVTEQRQWIPMRDGKRLSAWLYTPPGQGPWPALFEQRYASLTGRSTRQAAARLAERGYAVAMVNFRGAGESEGIWQGYRALGWGELQDGFDVCEWLAGQSWCTGKVGSFGSSQGGYAQNFLAVSQPPHLSAQYMVDTGLSLFQEGYRIGGTTRPERFRSMDSVCRVPEHNQQLMREWYRHPHYDDYWKAEDCSLHFNRMNVPCFTIGSWYDFMNQGSIASFQGREHKGGQQSRSNQQLIIGPWTHGRMNKGNRVGELIYPENAIWPEMDHMVRWFDYWLKDIETGVSKEPNVRYYVMGAVDETNAPGNFWRTAADFPPPHEHQSWYLQPASGLSTIKPNEAGGVTTFIADPLKPMEIPGRSFPGAKDARAFEAQDQVRTFTTDVLQNPVEWTGRVRAVLFLSSTAKDTDVIVRVSDVYPDGRSILTVDYPLRLRYRNGFTHEQLLTPGEVTKVEFDVGWISQIFNRGHRIRVTIASTGAPLYEPNPQTGEPLTIDPPINTVTAQNTIHHNHQWASHILAPHPLQN